MQVCVKASVEIASGTVSAAARKAGGSNILNMKNNLKWFKIHQRRNTIRV